MSSDTILIWGAGAIGGTLGAYLARAGEDVLLVDIVAPHVEAMNRDGLSIEGPVETFRQAVKAVTPDTVTGQFKRIILAVKAHHTRDAVRALMPHLAPDGSVLSAQNGLNELVIAEEIGPERTVGCFVNFGADWLEPGRILFGNRATVAVGEIDGSTTPRTQDYHRLLSILEPNAVLTDNIWGYLWGKLGYGAMLFATALTPASMSENLASEKHFPVFDRLGREVMAVALARGVSPLGFNGFDPAAFMPGADETAARRSVAAMAEFNRHTAKTHSGIWRDLAVRKRKTEVDAQIAIISQLGREAGIATPTIDKLVTLIHDIEENRREQSWATLDQLLEA
ncbi:ketopantoate reductase family protein [Microvirga sp. 17 mud 1-3]|uniref:ketopantoate reductase family protein n=1 Tax=Microvirga sp. 17 mud 1-3 TaxID=2082949 RepID=UPI000D6B96E8|nr:2-dehydropantoate 2-reductase [Microvirga sp. 17 mud 1-3]AWM85617.1 2-dehydropantoate 2-reductase [Microvirga sp. 17 mud 1-3]